jgi:hypothetical protein
MQAYTLDEWNYELDESDRDYELFFAAETDRDLYRVYTDAELYVVIANDEEAEEFAQEKNALEYEKVLS